MFNRFKYKIHFIVYYVTNNKLLILTISSLIIGFLGLLFSKDFITIIGFLSAGVTFLYEVYNYIYVSRFRYTQTNNTMLSDEDIYFTDEYKDWELLNIDNTKIMRSKEIDKDIDSFNPPLTTDERKFRPHQNLISASYSIILKRSKNYHIWDDDKIQLRTDIRLPLSSIREIKLRKTSYFYSLTTNGIVTKSILDKKNNNDDIMTKDLYLNKIDNRYYLRNLSDSKLSNHIGVSTMCITNDKKLLIQRQSDNCARSPGAWAPSGSGSGDYGDLVGVTNLRDLIIKVSERELIEEIRLDRFTKNSQIETIIIGYARNIMLGGKPEFFCFSKVPYASDDIGKEIFEKEFVIQIEYEELLYDNLERIDAYIRKYKHTSTWVLTYHLRLLKEYFERCPAQFPS